MLKHHTIHRRNERFYVITCCSEDTSSYKFILLSVGNPSSADAEPSYFNGGVFFKYKYIHGEKKKTKQKDITAAMILSDII